MMKMMKFFTALIGLIAFLSFTINDPGLKIVKYTRLPSGFVVVDYQDGKIKKQIKNKQLDTFYLNKTEIAEVNKEIDKLDIAAVVSEIDSYPMAEGNPATMYLFIKDNDTIKTNFFQLSKMPKQLRRLDYLLSKNRKGD